MITTIKMSDNEEISPSLEDGLNKGTIYYHNLKQAQAYKFEKFDIVKEFNDRRNFSCTITSKRCTGKSVLLKDLCYQMHKAGWYEQVHVFSMTADLQVDLFDFVKKENINIGFNEEKIIQIWEKQRELVVRIQKSKSKEKIPNILLLFDDLISDPTVRNSEILKRLFVAGRHLGFAQIFLTQQFTAVPPILRVNVDIAISFYLDSVDNREAFSKSYLSTKNTKLGIMVIERITKEPYQAIIVMNNKVSQNPEDYIRVYTAKLKLPKFMMYRKETLNHSMHTFVAENFPTSSANDLESFMPRIKKGGIKLD